MMESAANRGQQWSKLGRVFDPYKICPPGFSYASNPIFYKASGSMCHVFFTSRDGDGRSHTFCGHFDLNRPLESFIAEPTPIFSPGRPGHFDDAGVMATSVFLDRNGKAWLFYVGWNLARNVPFRNALGLAEIISEREVRRFSEGPIIDRSVHDPCFVASACATTTPHGYLLYYTSGEDWTLSNLEKFEHRYRLKIAKSDNLVDWQRRGEIAIDYANERETCITSPCVMKEGATYRMWFSFRGEHYRIGYAESSDGLKWARSDSPVSFTEKDELWENEAQCYPNVFSFEGKLYLLYNGNNYGASGFGLAMCF